MLKDNLRKAREKNGMTKAEAARRLGMKYSTYDSYEKGHRAPKPDQIPKIAKALGVNVAYLFTDDIADSLMDEIGKGLKKIGDEAQSARDSFPEDFRNVLDKHEISILEYDGLRKDYIKFLEEHKLTHGKLQYLFADIQALSIFSLDNKD